MIRRFVPTICSWLSALLIGVSVFAGFGQEKGAILALAGMCFGMMAWLVRMQCEIHDLEEELNCVHGHLVESTEILERILAKVTEGVKEQNEASPTSP